jgi:hypothetical protein
VAILKNLLDVVEKTSPSLRHVTFYQGGKAYGADLGPFKTPAREDDLRLMPPNFYYDQEDFLRERQQGKAWHWTALRPEATTGFGLGNPNYFRWKYLWPRIAAMFDMPAADPIPTPLTVYMADKKPVWEAIVRKRGLQPLPYEQVSSWPFADAILRLMEYDNITSTIKVRRAGFHDCVDTEEMFSKLFNDLRRMQVIP